ncbi:hypothetical protein BO70DRAFT_315497 [Aspergillus heteromorphus CBS 117.55]|uniref:Nudix hydrolase domain-containing protein n=1 Tax=Aspergillus heteromorphus CBS 117.55 TaxID=1448321 RepID=A0A317W6K1_9EURO|nr:uncharacterized protein BO70DRAFT_315497 [Aspergillus heteromorphus CBS 117.55]PWY81983.1 hypothetical protein BO70DRAFT_315497 [Aspergillus heteromorphus CBS 117.55]
MTINPRIGVGVFVLNPQGQFILGRRQGSHGSGTWALPGGHLELNESFEECAAREVQEETGLEVKDIRFLTATNDIMKAEGKHYVTIFVGCVLQDGSAEPMIMEPEKCSKWEWVTWEQTRSFFQEQSTAEENGSNDFAGRQLFIPILNLFRQRETFDPLVSYGV